MPVPFDTLTATQARARLPARPKHADELDAVLSGDMWRGGLSWLGELPADNAMLNVMARGIVGENVVLEIVSRYVAAVLGTEPRWKLVAAGGSAEAAAEGLVSEATSQAQAKRLKDIEADLTAWWDVRNVLGVLQQALARKAAEGRCALYVFIPPGLLADDGAIPTPRTLSEALRYLYVDARPPHEAGVHIDTRTRMLLGIVLGTNERGKTTIEVSYLNERRETVLRTIGVEGEPFVLDMNGHLFVHDSEMPPIITPQVLQGQKAITLALTQMMRNVNIAGNQQVDYINAQTPGQWIDATEGTPGAVLFPGNVWRVFAPSPYARGPGVSNFIQGNEIRNDEGELIGYSNPNVSIVPPSPVEHFERTYSVFRASAHRQCHQAHALMDDATGPSGLSREQARADFKTSLGRGKSAMDSAVRWLLEVALAYAAYLMGTPGIYRDLRGEASCVLNTGPLSPEEQNQIRSNVEAGLLSEETGMSMLGIEDVGAERQRILQERTERAASERVNATAILGQAGLLAQEARTAGGDDEDDD